MKQLSDKEQFITDFDVHLFNEGTNNRIYDKLGAHEIKLNGVVGTHFAVWAPNATKVSVIGDFNQWNREKNPMKRLEQSGHLDALYPCDQGRRDLQIPGRKYQHRLLRRESRSDWLLERDSTAHRFSRL